jgi:hypothetical protein
VNSELGRCGMRWSCSGLKNSFGGIVEGLYKIMNSLSMSDVVRTTLPEDPATLTTSDLVLTYFKCSFN